MRTFETVEEMKTESEKLLEVWRQGSYIFSPSHFVEGVTSLRNMLAFNDATKSQIK